ncbi:hypothetical protein NCY59_03635 [Acinetobacter radioresistens]|uniref:Uncharacterized protein n=1 Tax=uncultured Caudovirales phage TaxID=2100421 RepID=A0A2H4J4M8_9CAUD|nr:hypothetical protein [Acinetobacter radioresistens]ASN69529.1 hypothetical protein 2F2_12 [uncultured Caudovirales phage]MCM1934581.1 hypothetical protein [Acinetobacter radioresistens]MCM1952132.1 hypothetical protein [Acinetobacter radioresistens]MCU4308183.1 hypothetical protein [Acinetobacter radioresistens]
MNLIERLEGYDKAKIKRDDINHTLENCEFLGGGDAREGLYERLESIEQALLEYRRQHNIFEIGDKVVEITDYPSNDVLTVKSISHKLLVCESDDFNASYVLSNKYKPYFYVRRATDEEIKAGKRLEVV